MDKSGNKYDICIIGGGASGLVAAIRAADIGEDLSIAIVEKLDSPGHKIAAAGNGRCNLSNIASEDWKSTSVFFTELGLMTRTDDEGRIYPYSEDGRDVVRILTRACEQRDIDIITRRQVTEIKVQDPEYRFRIKTAFNRPKAYKSKQDRNGLWEDREIVIESKKVLIATGGKSKPKLGTAGDGYKLARELGHSINTLIPILTGIETSEDIQGMGLSGIRQKGRLNLKCRGELIFQEDGEIQFADYGISGICVFDMSRFVYKDFEDYEIEIDFAPDLPNRKYTEEELCSIVKEPLARAVSVSKTGSLKSFVLHPKGLRGWEMAQVTRGGVPTDEIDQATGESKICPRLYFSGEMIDVDFRCGGFNLQNSWSTGLRAGEAMAKNN